MTEVSDTERKEWIKVAGIVNTLEDCINVLRGDFQLSDNQIAKELRDKASELAPRKRTKVITIPSKVIDKIIERGMKEK